MTTASRTTAFLGRVRTLALAGTLAIGAMIPVVPATLASYDDPTPPVVTAPDQFDIAADGGLVGLTAVVQTGTGGAELLAEPTHDADTLQQLEDGSVVNLRVDMVDTVYDDDGVTRWWPVEIGGQEGWISGFFLVDPSYIEDDAPGDAPAESPVNRVPYDFTGSMQAEVSADGDGLVMRAEPDAASEVVTSLQDGTIVDLRIDVLDTVYDAQGTRWWPVAVDGFEGWVSGFYLIEPGTEAPVPTEDATTTPTPVATATATATQAPADDVLAVGDWAVIRTGNGRGVNLLAAPNAESGQSGFAPDNGLVEILADAGNGWFQVRWDDQTGYLDGDLLVEAEPPQSADRPSETPTATATTPARPSTDGVWVEGDEVQVDAESGVGVNMREEASIDSGRVGFLSNGALVEVTAGPSDDDEGASWYAVTDGDQSGWVRADLLSAPEEASADDPAPQTPSGVNDATGFTLPLADFRFTQDFGCSSLGFYSYDSSWGCAVHDGVDLAAPSGSPIVAVGEGEVVAAGWCDCGLGYYVEIDHGDGLHTVYGHMASQPYVSVGQQVAQGETIGPVGSTGLSTGPHVHFMVRQDGTAQDPKGYIPSLN